MKGIDPEQLKEYNKIQLGDKLDSLIKSQGDIAKAIKNHDALVTKLISEVIKFNGGIVEKKKVENLTGEETK